jgi:hypothetical protein
MPPPAVYNSHVPPSEPPAYQDSRTIDYGANTVLFPDFDPPSLCREMASQPEICSGFPAPCTIRPPAPGTAAYNGGVNVCMEEERNGYDLFHARVCGCAWNAQYH